MKFEVRIAAFKNFIGNDVAASIRKNFATNLRRLLRENSLKQKQFAKTLGISEPLASNWLNEVNFPDPENFDRIRATFGWSYEELVRDPEAPSPENLIEAIKKFADASGYDFKKRN